MVVISSASRPSPGRFFCSHDDIHILDRGTGCPFAQIVEYCRQEDALFISLYGYAHVIPECHQVCRDHVRPCRIGNADQAAGVQLFIDMQDICGCAADLIREERDHGLHTAVEIRYDRTEYRIVFQS